MEPLLVVDWHEMVNATAASTALYLPVFVAQGL